MTFRVISRPFHGRSSPDSGEIRVPRPFWAFSASFWASYQKKQKSGSYLGTLANLAQGQATSIVQSCQNLILVFINTPLPSYKERVMHNLVMYVVYGAFDAFFKTLAIMAALAITLIASLSAWVVGKFVVTQAKRAIDHVKVAPVAWEI